MFCKHEPAAREALPGNTDLAAQDCGCCCPALVNIPWRENPSFLQLQHAGSSACASWEGPASPWHGIQSCQPCPAGHTSSVHLSHQARTEASPRDGSDHGSHATPVPALWEPFPVADDECVRHRVTGGELSDTSVFRGSSALCDARGDAPGPGPVTRRWHQSSELLRLRLGSWESGKELWLQVKGGHVIAVSTAEIPEQPRG